MKKILRIALFISLLIIVIIIFNNNNNNSSLSYDGESENWQVNMTFDTNDKYSLNIKYKGQESLPLECKITINYLSGYSSTSVIDYTDMCDKAGGFSYEEKYNDDIHGDILRTKNKETLHLILQWENKI